MSAALVLEAKDRALVTGQTGTGKSHYAKALIAGELARGRRVLVLDVKDEWSNVSVDGTRRIAPGPLPYRWTATQLSRDPGAVTEPDLALAIVPNGPSPRDAARAFQLIAALLREVKLPVLLVLEEVQYWERYAREDLEAVATMWRDFGVAVLFVSQRAAGVPIDARSQINAIVSFAQQEPADIEALEDRTALTDPTFADRVSRLSGRQSLTWRAGVSNGEEQRRDAEQGQPGQDGSDGGGGPVRVRVAEEASGGADHQGDAGGGDDRGQVRDPLVVPAASSSSSASSPAAAPKKPTRGGRRVAGSRTPSTT